MIGNEQHHNNNTAMENNAKPITKSSRMKHGWHQTISNTVHYYQTPFNIALILEQVSNYNNLLREQTNTEKASWIRQNNMISDGNMFMSKLCATANEHTPKELDDKNKDKDSEVRYDDKWIQPKQSTPKRIFLNAKIKK